MLVSPTRDLELEHNVYYLHQLPGDIIRYCSRDEIRSDRSDIQHDILADDLGSALEDSGHHVIIFHSKWGHPSNKYKLLQIRCLDHLAVVITVEFV
jgi:hypothetical protein